MAQTKSCESRDVGSARIACAVAMSPLILLVVALRFFTGIRITKDLGLDDWIIGFAVLSL